MIDLLKKQLKALYTQLIALSNVQTAASKELLALAISKKGTDVSPYDRAADAYGCAETASTLLNLLDPTFTIVTGTYTLDEALLRSANFVQVQLPLPGDLVIYPTGKGGTKEIPNGHVGVVGERGEVWSNNSKNGLLDNHLTVSLMRKIFRDLGHYQEHYFRKVF